MSEMKRLLSASQSLWAKRVAAFYPEAAGGLRERRKGHSTLQVAAAGERAAECRGVAVLEIAAGGQSARQARHLDAERLKHLGEIERGRFSFDSRVGCDDDFANRAGVAEPHGQFFYLDVVGADAVERGDRAMKYVIDTVVTARALDRHQVGRPLDHTNQIVLARRIVADAASHGVGQAEAFGAEPHPLLHFEQRLGQRDYFLARTVEQVESESRRCFFTDSGKTREFFDEPRHRGRQTVAT